MTMIINAGRRRLCSYRYGWVIEIEHTNKKGVKVWKEDYSPYPASLSDALETVLERELMDGGDCALQDIPERLKCAIFAVRHYMEMARKAA